jgi:hypothetical protein
MKAMIGFVESNGYAQALGLEPTEENWKGYFYAVVLLATTMFQRYLFFD